MSRRSTPAASLAAALAAVALASCSPAPEAVEGDAPVTLRDRRTKMGTFFEVQLVTADERAGRAAIEAAFDEIDRVEALLSEWQPTSEISELNRRAGQGPVPVGPELYAVLERSLEVAEATSGAFDVRFATCGGLWSFREPRIPSEDEIAACVAKLDDGAVVLDPDRRTAAITHPDVRIGIAGIGKGYGVDRAADVLERRGFDRFLVDGGGDVRVCGTNVGRPWNVGIADPRRRGDLLGIVHAVGGAIVTSGDYESFFERDGVRYHHILDPRTGRPARASVAVTVIAPDATFADALATGLFVLGPAAGLERVERMSGVEALFVGPGLDRHASSGFPPILPVPVPAGS